jgi:16S rRNA processing protein RimM
MLVRPDGQATPARVQEVWMHKDRLIFKFEGVDSISQAELWKGAAVCVPPEKRPELPAGEYYLSDLVDCTVVNRISGDAVGSVVGWQETGGPVLLEIESKGREEPLLVPFVPAICVLVDVAAKRIEIDPPEGLLEL